MRSKILYSSIILALFAALGLSTPAAAGLSQEGADYLVQLAERYAAEGRLDEAIHEMSKALLIQPDHARAKAFLAEHGMNRGMYTGSETNHTRIAEMAVHMRQYKEQIADLHQEKQAVAQKLGYIEKEREALYQSNLAKGLEIDLLQEKVKSFKELSRTQDQEFREQIRSVELQYVEQTENLRYTLAKYDAQNHALDEVFVDKDKELYELRAKLNEVVAQSLGYEDQLAFLDTRSFELEDRVRYQDTLIGTFEDYSRMNQASLLESQNELVYKEMDLTHTQNKLYNRLNELVGVYGSVGEYVDKVAERDIVIDEQEARIDQLMQELYGQ